MGASTRDGEKIIMAKKKQKKAAPVKAVETEVEDTKNPAISRFESVFYRFFAWFPILVLPAMVWEMFSSGDYGMGAVIAFIHAILVFRFVTVVKFPKLFKSKTAQS